MLHCVDPSPSSCFFLTISYYPLAHTPFSLLSYTQNKTNQSQGMAFPLISVGGALPPFHNGVKQQLWAEPLFSFWLNRDPDSKDGGELLLGGINPAHFSGEHTW